jgi:hypothetical protein
MSADGDREVLERSKSSPRTEVKLCDESVDGGKWIVEMDGKGSLCGIYSVERRVQSSTLSTNAFLTRRCMRDGRGSGCAPSGKVGTHGYTNGKCIYSSLRKLFLVNSLVSVHQTVLIKVEEEYKHR